MTNKYCFVLNSVGERVASLVDNVSSDEELIVAAKKLFPDRCLYFIGGDDMLNQFLDGKIYVKGEFIDPPRPLFSKEGAIAQKLMELSLYLQEEYIGSFQSSASGIPMYYDSTLEDQSNIDKMLQASKLDTFERIVGGKLPIRGAVEKDGDKVDMLLDAEEIQQLWTDMTLHIMAIKKEGWELTDRIKAVTTQEELDAITIGKLV